MTDIDLAPLRDSNPPAPGARERAAVEMRARRLRSRSRLVRATAVLAAVAVVGVFAIAVDVSNKDARPTVVIEPTTTPTTLATGFVLPTHTDGAETVLPMTSADGRRFELHFPAGVDLTGLDYHAQSGGAWDVTDPRVAPVLCCSRSIDIRYGMFATTYGDASVLARYLGADGDEVRYVDATKALDPTVRAGTGGRLVFQFGPWLAEVDDPLHSMEFEAQMTDDQRATWARSLTGSVDADGYLLLHAKAPLAVSPLVEIVLGATDDETRHIEVSDAYCDATSSTARPAVTVNPNVTAAVGWCEPNRFFIQVVGPRSFVEAVRDGLRLTGP